MVQRLTDYKNNGRMSQAEFSLILDELEDAIPLIHAPRLMSPFSYKYDAQYGGMGDFLL